MPHCKNGNPTSVIPALYSIQTKSEASITGFHTDVILVKRWYSELPKESKWRPGDSSEKMMLPHIIITEKYDGCQDSQWKVMMEAVND